MGDLAVGDSELRGSRDCLMVSSMGVAQAFLIVAVCLVTQLSLPVPATASISVHIESHTECLDEEQLQLRIGKLLEHYEGGSEGSITVAGSPGETATIATLRVVTVVGEVVLDRLFELRPEDCPSAVDLFATVLEQFLREFPREGWGEDPQPQPVPERIIVTQDVTEFAGRFFVAADTRWQPTSGDLELGATLDVGSDRHRLTASAAFRVGYPHKLGGGQYIENLALLGVGWRYASQNWLTQIEVRTGGLVVSGFGYAINHHTWLLWLEAQGAIMWHWHGVLMGPQVGVSPLQHRVVTVDGDVSAIPRVRIGVVVAIPFWSQKM